MDRRSAELGRKLTDYQLARLCGVPQPTLHRILSGESKDPKTATVKKIAGYFGVTVEDLRGSGRDFGATTGRFSALSQDAMDILAAWERLPPERQQAYRDTLLLEVFAREQMPWVRRSRPNKESYDDFERRMKSSWESHHGTTKK